MGARRIVRGYMAVVALASTVGLLTACGSEATPEEQAMEEATRYYEQLLEGDYDAFLQGRADADNLTDDYREQLLCACKQYVRRQQHINGGITGIKATRALADSTLGVMQVFMLCNYADSNTEEIVVPMVEHNGEWKLK